MSNIAKLNCFSKLFVLFGLQYYSNNKKLKFYSRKIPEITYTIYFICLLIPLTFLLVQYICSIFIREPGEDEVVNAKSYFNKASNIVMESGLIASLFSGLIESYFKINVMKKLLLKFDEISSLCNREFRHQVDYEVFKKKWIRNFIYFVSIYLASYATWAISCLVTKSSVVPLLINIWPLFLFSLIIFKFVFYVDLVNFQLENLNIVSSQSSINKTSRVAFVNVLNRKTLALRKFYCLIFDSAQLVNTISTFSIFFTLIVLVIVLINALYRSFIVTIGGLPFNLVVRKFNLNVKRFI